MLDADFRKSLYKGLVDAGYEKEEAQKIIGVKYSTALKEELIGELKQLITNIEEGKYEFTIKVDEFTNGLSELSKLDGFLKKE